VEQERSLTGCGWMENMKTHFSFVSIFELYSALVHIVKHKSLLNTQRFESEHGQQGDS
jgi:hypothetical protein